MRRPPGHLAEEAGRFCRPGWIHGDLYGRHLLVDPEGALAGVLDWGDVALGDPALDLSVAYSFLPEDQALVWRHWNPLSRLASSTRRTAIT